MVAFHQLIIRNTVGKFFFSAEAKLFVMTGLLGGFTTFSTYLLNFITLLNENKITEGFVYLLLSVLAGSLFLLAGIRLAS